MNTGQETSTTRGLTRRTALAHAAVGGIAAVGLGIRGVSAQEATSVPNDDEPSALSLARLAKELPTALVPVIADIRAQSDDELAESARQYLEQLKEQKNVTEEEASTLEQILEVANSDADPRTKIDQLQEIADSLAQEEADMTRSVAVAIAEVVVAGALRNRRSDSTASPTAEEDEDTGLWDHVKWGLVGALAGAVIGDAIAGHTGAVLGAIAGGLAGAL